MVTVDDGDGLGKAMAQDEEEIEVNGDFARHVSRLWGLDRVLWKICLILLATVVLLVLAVPVGGPVLAAYAVAGSPVVGILGAKTAAAAVGIAAAGGGVRVLEKLKGYRLEQINDTHIILYRK